MQPQLLGKLEKSVKSPIRSTLTRTCDGMESDNLFGIYHLYDTSHRGNVATKSRMKRPGKGPEEDHLPPFPSFIMSRSTHLPPDRLKTNSSFRIRFAADSRSKTMPYQGGNGNRYGRPFAPQKSAEPPHLLAHSSRCSSRNVRQHT